MIKPTFKGQLGSDEYFSFSLRVQNSKYREFSWERGCVVVDNGAPWCWGKGQIKASGCACFHIAYRNMKTCMVPGTYTVAWYFDGQLKHRERFVITQERSWESVFHIPDEKEIMQYRNVRNLRSPYIMGWYLLSAEIRYTEYMVDFKTDHIPKGTYCSLGAWAMDYSGLKKNYRFVQSENNATHAYAGFQRIDDGRMVSIMSVWDIYCQDVSGNKKTISAKRLYPQNVINGGKFWGEGDGERSIAPFAWEAKHYWYRMHLKSIPAQDKTLLEQWVCDIETGNYTLLCRYELAVPNAVFKGNIAVFLGNYLTETAGEVRSMEVRNAKYLHADTKRCQTIKQVQLSSMDGLPHYEGSYNFGVTGNCVWMITSGIGGDWFHNGKGKKATNFTLH
ncbi:MAG: DUF3472 domain-containing protein [Clostridia bacterium]|nr:DUF3472 domain-containing protein [Clostridia bacterium]